jgi:NTE family protein
VSSLPRSLRVLLRTMGALNTGGGQLMSYLLFQDTYTRELIALGYQDAMKRSEELLAFLGGYPLASTGATGVMRRLSMRRPLREEQGP